MPTQWRQEYVYADNLAKTITKIEAEGWSYSTLAQHRLKREKADETVATMYVILFSKEPGA